MDSEDDWGGADGEDDLVAHDEYEFMYEQVSFVDCTCEHDRECHDWTQCTMVECKCQGHWEEQMTNLNPIHGENNMPVMR